MAGKGELMLLLFVLVVGTLLGAVPWRGRRRTARDAARVGMAVAMVVAGVLHLVAPTPFLQHLPPWVPAAGFLVTLTGMIEIALGSGLLAPLPWRRFVAVALALYLVAVFPANVYVAVAGVDVQGQPGGIYPWLRLPFQILFVWWALWSTPPHDQPDSRSAADTVATEA